MMFCPEPCVAHHPLAPRDAGVKPGHRPRLYVVPERLNPDFLLLQERASAIAEALERGRLDLVDQIVANTATNR